MKIPNSQLCTWWQDITEEITQTKRSRGLESGDADFGFQHVGGLSFLGEEHTEVTAYQISFAKQETTEGNKLNKLLEGSTLFCFSFLRVNYCLGFLILSVSGKRRVNFRLKTKINWKKV